MVKTLVTGGCGYIGSHTTLALLNAGIDVVVLDNLSNSSAEVINRISKLTGRKLEFILGDVRDQTILDKIFKRNCIQSVLHFAGLKSVQESIFEPLVYFDNNVHGTEVVLRSMQKAGVFNFIFSSSATVYGEPKEIPITELCPIGNFANPYGRSKFMAEEILRDLASSDSQWSIGILRYFNPVGAHKSGIIGEDSKNIPNNLLPFISKVAMGKITELIIYGSDYPTLDGTGVRDYIHVQDLAEGHLLALLALESRTGAHVWNLGTGRGYSVLEILRAFEKCCGKSVPFRMASRRPGDVATCYSDPRKAELDLGWKANLGLTDMVSDAWRWQLQNPNGYKS
jgi:UDP-glucose 4-epimerase